MPSRVTLYRYFFRRCRGKSGQSEAGFSVNASRWQRVFSLGEATDHAFHARDKRESSAPFPRQSFFSIALLPAKAKLETTQRYFERNNALQARACYRLMQDAFHGASPVLPHPKVVMHSLKKQGSEKHHPTRCRQTLGFMRLQRVIVGFVLCPIEQSK